MAPAVVSELPSAKNSRVWKLRSPGLGNLAASTVVIMLLALVVGPAAMDLKTECGAEGTGSFQHAGTPGNLG